MRMTRIPKVVKVTRRTNLPTESMLQQKVIQWCRMNENRLPKLKLLFAVPNGGSRHIATAIRLRAEGVRRGVPDLMLPALYHKEYGATIEEYSGIAIELKRGPKDKARPEQQEYMELLRWQGWFCCVEHDFRAVIEKLEWYCKEWYANERGENAISRAY